MRLPLEPLTLAEVRASYVTLLDALAGVCRGLQVLPLQEMAQVNEEMQTLAPMLEPTAYMRGGGGNLHDQRRVIDAAAALKNVLEDLRR